jgi:MFS family permease
MGLATGPLGYALAWTFIGLAGASALTTPAQIAVAEIAGAKARQALGILILAGGLTSTVVWPLTGLLQAQYGWRATTLLFAAAMLVICTPLHWMALARRPRATTAGAKAATDEPVAIDRPRFVLFALSFAANGFVTWGFALTIIILFEANGLDHASALAAAAFIGVAQWAGRMFDVIVPKRGAGFRVSLAGGALFPLSLLVLMTTASFASAAVFAVLYGIASGVTAVARATLPLQIFPAGVYARASARLAVPLNLAFASAPPAFAALMTSAGPHAALWVALATSIVAFAALLALAIIVGRTAMSPQPDAVLQPDRA